MKDDETLESRFKPFVGRALASLTATGLRVAPELLVPHPASRSRCAGGLVGRSEERSRRKIRLRGRHEAGR